MLSQDTGELPDDKKSVYLKGLSNVANWVRRTHVVRIDKLIKQLLREPYLKRQGYDNLIPHLNVIIGMAASHSKWSWETDFVSGTKDIAAQGLTEERIAALNAVIAVCDLLDEDSNRCDTITLIKHRQGSIENMAHWIRHSLTKEVIGVCNHNVEVYFRLLKPECDNLEMVYRTLRNHYRLVKLYNEKLKSIHAEIKSIRFYPADGCPDYEDDISDSLNVYKDIKEFEYDLVPQLMKTFMREALNDDGGDKSLRKRLNEIGLENIDFSPMDEFIHPNTLFYDGTMTFVYYYFNGDKNVAAEALSWLMYIRGALEVNQNEKFLKDTVQALMNLRKLSFWMQPEDIDDIDERRLRYEVQFVQPIYRIAKESNDKDVRKWVKKEAGGNISEQENGIR